MNDSAALGTVLSFLGLLENGDSPALQLLGKYGFKLYSMRVTIQEWLMYIHLIIAAIFPIYIAAHASLCQPPSAAKAVKLGSEEEEEDDELDVAPTVEGLTPSDAIMFPVTASIVLGGLYFFIKWMGDAKLLNKIMTVYFSFLGVFTLAKMLKDGLDLITSFMFPSIWSDGRRTYYIDSYSSQQHTGDHDPTRNDMGHEVVPEKSNPFPGFLSNVKFSSSVTRALWLIRSSFKKHWILRGYIHGIFSGKQKVHLNGMIGLMLSIAAVTYYNTIGKVWWITNLMGFGFSYTSMQLMSPTTFSTGSLVLGGLFIYDIVMVFYTPMMATVATSLEVPIKLVFPGPKRGSMLGLGDVVLPGIMLTLALRFDLYLHYLRKQRKSSVDASSEAATLTTTGKKAVYWDPKGLWGERFWTRKSKATSLPLTHTEGPHFPKVYFKAGVIGYILAMIVTLYVCTVAQHPQPALLYLVPGVLTALWGTAYFRGEIPLMWGYTEDGEWGWDDESLGVKKAEKRRLEKKKEAEAGEKGDLKKVFVFGENNGEDEKKDEVVKKAVVSEHAHHVFLFSLSEPKHEVAKEKSI